MVVERGGWETVDGHGRGQEEDLEGKECSA